ncbi:MAG: histidine kinase, partial [Epsilonproteobacteria bacterium]|nr:histidine kinase [Campylobacterota bacterium]
MKHFNLTKRYILALSIIALLSTLAYFNIYHLISNQYSNSNIINISGKQRLLSQQISFNAIYYKIDELKKNIKEMEQNHKRLIDFAMDEELKELFFKPPTLLDMRVKRYIKEAKEFAKSRSGRSLTYLLNNSKPLLEDLDKAAQLYVKKAQKATTQIMNLELYLYILTLITLFME